MNSLTWEVVQLPLTPVGGSPQNWEVPLTLGEATVHGDVTPLQADNRHFSGMRLQTVTLPDGSVVENDLFAYRRGFPETTEEDVLLLVWLGKYSAETGDTFIFTLNGN